MKKLLAILGTVSISSPIFFNICSFSNINNLNLADDFSKKYYRWGQDCFIKLDKNIIKENNSFAIYQGMFNGKKCDYFLTSNIEKDSIDVLLFDEQYNSFKWKPLITNLGEGKLTVYKEIFVFNDKLYFFNKGYNQNAGKLFWHNLKNVLDIKNINDLKPTTLNDIKENEVRGVNFKDTPTYSYCDAKNNVAIVGNNSMNPDIYFFDDTKEDLIVKNGINNIGNDKFFQSGKKIKKIFLNDVLDDNKNLFYQRMPTKLEGGKEKENLILSCSGKNPIVFDNPEITAIETFDNDNVLLATNNRIYKAPIKDIINQQKTDNVLKYKNYDYEEYDKIGSFWYINYNNDKKELEFTSDKGAGLIEDLKFNKSKNTKVTFVTNLNLERTMPIKVNAIGETKNKYNLYFLKDDNSGFAYLREYIQYGEEIKKAYSKAIDARGIEIRKDLKEEILTKIKINLREKVWFENFIDKKLKINKMSPEKNKNDWYLEQNLDLCETFLRTKPKNEEEPEANVKISSYDISFFENLNDLTTNVGFVKDEPIKGDSLEKVFKEVEDFIGKHIEIKDKPKELTLDSNNQAKLTIKIKSDLLLKPEHQKNIEKEITINFRNLIKGKVTGQFKDETCKIGLYPGEEFEFLLENWKKNLDQIKLSNKAKYVSIKSGPTLDKNDNGALLTLKVDDNAKVNENVIIDFEKTNNYDMEKFPISSKILDNKISVKNFSDKLKIGKTKKITIINHQLYSDVKVSILEEEKATLKDKPQPTNFSKIDYSYDKNNGQLTIKGLEFGKPIKIAIEATSARKGAKIEKFEKWLQVIEIPPFPIWAIVLLTLALLGLLGFLAWFLWFKFRGDNFYKAQPRYAAIKADHNAVAKTRKTPVAKTKRDRGIVRSGLFERDLDYTHEKLNDPDYQNKYVWAENDAIEDSQPIVNNWNEKNISSNAQSDKKDPKLESRLDKVKKRSESPTKTSKKVTSKSNSNQPKTKSKDLKSKK